ncbi:MAG TPA: hypothetical protein VM050_05265 [Patescibacteria group bacterium]|nr:hypothetical protein [Patescibacteria group bacterium]
MEKPKDKDLIETVEGLLFCVVGYLHPPDWYTAYLKYVQDPEGKWKREDARFSRVIPYYHVSQVEATYGLLRERYSQYIYRCPVRNITLSSVPRDRVRRYYRPRKRLASIIEEGHRDELEWKLTDLVTILTGLSGLKAADLGVTGSILTASHNPEFSDIDITVYGRKASESLKETILESRREETLIQPFNAAKREVWSRSRSGRFPLSFEELMEFSDRRWNYGFFRDTYFSIHPVRRDSEIEEEYGDNTYHKKGEAEGKAVVSDNKDSIFLPAVYEVDQIETTKNMEISKIVSYESIYCDMFDPGDRIEFRGVIEQVTGKDEHKRVVIGGAGSAPSFMRRLK